MKKIIIAAAFALSACGQPAATTEEAAPAPPNLMDQFLAKAPEQQPVDAWTLLTAYQGTHPEAVPPCTSIRVAESRGVIPADVDPASAYGPYAGALAYSIQCGPQLTATRMDPNEHWLVVMPVGATEATIVHCVGPTGADTCPRAIPRAAPAPAAPATAPATTP
jgi:hypothetical protein